MEKVVLIPINESYMRVDASSGVFQEISDFFSFFVKNYQHMKKFKAGWWDGKIRMMSYDGKIYKGFISHLQVFCDERDYVLDRSAFDNEYSPITEEEAIDFINSLNLPHEYRQAQLEAFLHGVNENRMTLISPTASGKSMIAYMFCRWHKRKRKLIVVPTTGLVLQMVNDFASYGAKPELIHTIMDGKDKNTRSEVTVSTWQSIHNLPAAWFEQFDVIIGDEVHHFKADCLKKIMEKSGNAKHRYGMTGSLDDSLTNRTVLEGLFGRCVKFTSTAQLMEEGHVAKIKINCVVFAHPEADRKKMYRKKYAEEIKFLCQHEKRNKSIASLARTRKGNTLVLFNFIEHGKALYDLMTADGRKVHFIYGGVAATDRERIRKIVETEDDAIILASFGTTSTGISINRLHNIVFAHPVKSIVRILQSIGRGLRLANDKEYLYLYDIADDLSTGPSSMNYALLHFIERTAIYRREKFPYKVKKFQL